MGYKFHVPHHSFLKSLIDMSIILPAPWWQPSQAYKCYPDLEHKNTIAYPGQPPHPSTLRKPRRKGPFFPLSRGNISGITTERYAVCVYNIRVSQLIKTQAHCHHVIELSRRWITFCGMQDVGGCRGNLSPGIQRGTISHSPQPSFSSFD